ncbi:hypothetical protein SmJEL517_g00371 [Synchytrium microbalum]|uniref:Uncharacterized protein n=1 Tax=Synchytrium microbalum TaxID=1806994 RepID=A0A507C984_9FUNG|nr:uncharacterized protein SmJEL517_g00371 [Synchytrium microbalum]TPX38150.1 hypothetical protein SmJEL517_g00371 [Synchytrium microbalum]
MEKSLNSTLDSLANSPKVKGVIAVDAQGLRLGHRGRAQATAAPLFESIASRATKLAAHLSSSSAAQDVLITVESDMQ